MVLKMEIGMITETNMTATKSCDWWLNSGATIHVCNDKNLFSLYQIEKERQTSLMGNHNVAVVAEKGMVEINFFSRKKMTLNNIFYVPDIRKNLASANLMCKNRLNIVLEGNTYIVSKNEAFVGKCYSSEGMYKLSIIDNKDIMFILLTLLIFGMLN